MYFLSGGGAVGDGGLRRGCALSWGWTHQWTLPVAAEAPCSSSQCLVMFLGHTALLRLLFSSCAAVPNEPPPPRPTPSSFLLFLLCVCVFVVLHVCARCSEPFPHSRAPHE